MTKFNHHCKICDTILSDTRNALSLHIRQHNISKEEYFQTFVDPRNTCKNCKRNVKFLNLQLGYPEYCLSCAVKVKQWSGEKGENRKKYHKELIEKRGGGGSLGGAGKRKGVKNKTPYPKTELVLERIEKSKLVSREYSAHPAKILKQKITWESKTDEEIALFNNKRTESSMKKGSKYYQGKYTPKVPSKYKGDPTQVFYRSSWELKFFNWCDNNNAVERWSSEEIVIPYISPVDNRVHRYFVDAMIQVNTKEGLKTYLIEIKPDVQTRPPKAPSRKTKQYLTEVMTWGVNEAKWKAAERYAKDRGWEFKVLTEHDLGIK